MELTKRKTRDHVFYNDGYENIIAYALENGFDTFTFPGSLLDHTLIYCGKAFTLGKLKPREYIIIEPEYLNEWSSAMKITLTDNEEKYELFMQSFYEYEEEEGND